MQRVWQIMLQAALLAIVLLVAPAVAAEPVVKVPAEPPTQATAAAETVKNAPANPAAESSDELDDPAAPFSPLVPRGGRDEDRVRALALFAAGRVAEQQQDYPQALKRYQRAFRMDPGATAALREIVPLAFNLDRQAEAVRYALIMAEREPNDPALLRRLAAYLTEEGDLDRALVLYEKALALQGLDKTTPSKLVMRMEIGRLCFVAKQYEAAANHFAEVVKALDNAKEYGLDESMQKALVNKPEMTWQVIGESFLAANRPAEALAAFEKANQAKPNEGLNAYNLARVDQKQKQPAQALAKLEPYFAQHLNTQGTAPYQVLADSLADLGQGDQLIARLEKLHSDDPGNIPLAYFLAQRYRQADQLDKAEPIYADMIARNAARPPIEAFQGLIDVYHQRKNPDKLLDIVGESLTRVGTMAPLGDSGKALLDDTETCKSVLAAAQRLANEDPFKLTFGARLAAASIAIELKDFTAANRFFDMAIAAEPKKAGEVLVTWGLELFLANQYADAAKVFERGLKDNVLPQKQSTLYFYLAGALESSGRTDEAIEAARKAAELEKDAPRFASRAAWIQYHAKRYDAARNSYQELIEKYDKKYDSPEVREAMRDARLVMSNISVLENKTPESEEWLEQVLDEFPEDVGAMNDLGYVWADEGKHLERALQMIQTAVAREPKNMAYRDSLGWVFFRLGRYNEALAELKVAAAVDEPDGVILDHLAEALAKSGDTGAAVEAWQRSVAAFEKTSDMEKAKQAREKMARAQGTAVKK